MCGAGALECREVLALKLLEYDIQSFVYTASGLLALVSSCGIVDKTPQVRRTDGKDSTDVLVTLQANIGRRAWSSLLAALLLWGFFYTTKHSPVFSPYAPFDIDPYDVVGSFTFQIAIAVGALNVVRLELIKRQGTAYRLPYVRRGIAVVAVCIAITMASDTIAILRAGLHAPRSHVELAVWIAIAVFALISAILIAGLLTRANVSAPANGAEEFDWIFQRPMFRALDPRGHAVRFAFLLGLTIGIAATAVEIVGDGPAPTLRQTILVIIIRIAIEAFGVFIGFLFLGTYLGLVAFHGKQTP